MTSQNPTWELSRERGRVAAAAELEELETPGSTNPYLFGAAALKVLAGEPVIWGSHRENKPRYGHARLKFDRLEEEWGDIEDWSSVRRSPQMRQALRLTGNPDFLGGRARLLLRALEDSEAMAAERNWRWDSRSRHLTENPGGETVEEYLARGGKISKISFDLIVDDPYKSKVVSSIGLGTLPGQTSTELAP